MSGAGSQRADRIGRYRRGRTSEHIAAALLIAKGYRILARRHRTPSGEIDLIAKRGRRLAFVEVKARANRAEAEAALKAGQTQRMRRAADFWLSRHPRYDDFSIGFDAVFVLPWRWPIHVPDALQK